MKKLLASAVMFFGLIMGNTAHAGIPVIDAANLAQAIQQVTAWAQQYTQMVEQYNKLQQQYNSLNGARAMAGLAPITRGYLPSEYQTILDSGFGASAAIRSASKVMGIEDTRIGPTTEIAKAFESNAKQAAINRATTEEAYKRSSDRFTSIQILLDKVNNAPDAKDMADLQGRIQAEQAMLANENAKLAMLGQLASAQRDLAAQRSLEMRMKSVETPNLRF